MANNWYSARPDIRTTVDRTTLDQTALDRTTLDQNNT